MAPRLTASLAFTGALLVAALPVSGQAPVSDPRQLEARVERLERTLSSSSLLNMHQALQDLRREVRELRGEIEVQTHELEQIKRRQRDLYVDMDRRVRALEAASAAAPPAVSGTPAGVPPDTGTPSVPDPAVAAAPATAAAPPVAAAPGPGSPAADPATAPAAPASATTTAAAPAAMDPAAEQQAYRKAFELLKGGNFSEASAALSKFLAEYPNGRFADNAQYWLGESYYVSREFAPALKAFEQLLADYPDSPKRSHAMLKIGFIHDEAGRKEQARQVLDELIKTYPQSTAASLADKRLKRLQ